MKKENRGGPRVAGPGKKMGRPIVGKKRQFQIRLQNEICDKIEKYCIATGQTKTYLMEIAIVAYLSKLNF